MNILAPIKEKENIKSFIANGATELYMGFYDENWEKRFGKYSDLNRMSGFERDANGYQIMAIKEFVKEAHSYGGKLFVTLNSAYYTAEQMTVLKEYGLYLKDISVDGIIVSSKELVTMFSKMGISTVASTMCGVYNHEIAKILVAEGVTRIILPRDLSLNEIESIIQNVPDVEYEVFMTQSGCKFSDSFCLGFHRFPYGALCENLQRAKCSIGGCTDDFYLRQVVSLNETYYNMLFHETACGLCALYRLNEMKISACKIVGRAKKPEYIQSDIELIKNNLKIVEECKSEKEYLEKMLFPLHKDRTCYMGKSCYYPELRFGSQFKNTI